MTDSSNPSTNTLMRQLLDKKDLTQILISGLSQAISQYTNTKVTTGAPFLQAKHEASDIAVIGMIRFEAKDLAIELFMAMSKDLFNKLYTNLFNSPVKEINSENHDLAGEMLNIAFGIMDPNLIKIGYRMVSSFPKMYSGHEMKTVLSKISNEAIVLPFEADGQKFAVELFSANSLKVEWQFERGKKIAS